MRSVKRVTLRRQMADRQPRVSCRYSGLPSNSKSSLCPLMAQSGHAEAWLAMSAFGGEADVA